MSVTDDVRAAKRQRQFHSARDFETSASQIGDVDPFSEQMRHQMQRIICGNAKGRSKKAQRADAELLMMMLGVHPCQEPATPTPIGPTPSLQIRSSRR